MMPHSSAAPRQPTQEMAIRIVLLDDHPLVVKGLEQLLQSSPDFEVLATCSTVSEGLQAIKSLKPDVLVLDLKLAGEDGLTVLRRLDSTKPPAVVVLTASHDEDDLLAAARLGARGIVLKAMAPRMLEDCLRTVYAGGRSLSVDGVDLARRLTQRQSVEDELERVLTPRELEILRLVAVRLDNQEISARLAISVGTVKIHLHHVYEKLQLRGRHDLQVYLRDRLY
jgi:DNA-binding NarL/FixJ family response regulator